MKKDEGTADSPKYRNVSALIPCRASDRFFDLSSLLYGTSQAGGGSVRSWRVWSLLNTVKTKKREAVATSVTDRSPFPLPFCSLILNACLDSSSSTVDGGHSKSLLYQTIITFLYKTNSLILKRYCDTAMGTQTVLPPGDYICFWFPYNYSKR